MSSISRHPETLAPHGGWRAGRHRVSEGYVRLSVGREHIDDIIADLDRGFAAAREPSVARAA